MKKTSNNLLNPQPEAEDFITNSCMPLSEYNSIKPSTINISSIYLSAPPFYQEYQTKLL